MATIAEGDEPEEKARARDRKGGDDEKKPSGNQIPGVVHFIWLGSPVPSKYQASIKNWALHATDFPKTWLWYDSKFVAAEKMSTDFDGSSVVCCDVNTVEALLTDCYLKESGRVRRLDGDSKSDPGSVAEKPNWGAASDLLRALILYKFGGLYCDTDNTWKGDNCKVLPSLTSPIWYRYTENNAIVNDFIAAPPGSDIIRLYSELQHSNLRKLYKGEEVSDCSISLAEYMSELGPSKIDARPLFTITCIGPMAFSKVVTTNWALLSTAKPIDHHLFDFLPYGTTCPCITFSSDGTWYRKR